MLAVPGEPTASPKTWRGRRHKRLRRAVRHKDRCPTVYRRVGRRRPPGIPRRRQRKVRGSSALARDRRPRHNRRRPDRREIRRSRRHKGIHLLPTPHPNAARATGPDCRIGCAKVASSGVRAARQAARDRATPYDLVLAIRDRKGLRYLPARRAIVRRGGCRVGTGWLPFARATQVRAAGIGVPE
jgi:hypothetical protein